MFVLCPHCQFLVALDPSSGQPPLRCPRCERGLRKQSDAEPADASIAVETAATPPPPEAADVGAEQPEGTGVGATQTATATDLAEDAGPAATGGIEPAETIRDTELPDGASEPADADVVAETMPEPVADEAADISGLPEPTPGSEPEPETGIAPTGARSAVQPARRKPGSAPSFARASKPALVPDPRRRWLRFGAIAALSLLLGLQLLLADRDRLAADARWRPTLTILCGVLQCTLPPWREPFAFTLLNRDVRPHPTVPGALRVTATFRNDARWPQPWPALLLTLSDLDGRNAGARVFAAREYLGAPPTRSGLASGQSAMIALDVLEPAPRIVAFTFDFR